MAEWTHYSLPNAEWEEAVASIGGIPSLLQGTDIPYNRAVINEMVRKGVEAAGNETCEFILEILCLRLTESCMISGRHQGRREAHSRISSRGGDTY